MCNDEFSEVLLLIISGKVKFLCITETPRISSRKHAIHLLMELATPFSKRYGKCPLVFAGLEESHLNKIKEHHKEEKAEIEQMLSKLDERGRKLGCEFNKIYHSGNNDFGLTMDDVGRQAQE